MAELKTKQTNESVTAFINTVADEQKRKDSSEVLEMMKTITGLPPKMWGPAIIGFGSYHYKYDSGHEGDMCMTGFSPRKQNLTLYVINNAPEIPALLQKLGKHTTGKCCLYIKRLGDVNKDVLKEIIHASFEHEKSRM